MPRWLIGGELTLVTTPVPIQNALHAVDRMTSGVAVIIADGLYARAVCLADAREAARSTDRVMEMDPATDWRGFALLAEKQGWMEPHRLGWCRRAQAGAVLFVSSALPVVGRDMAVPLFEACHWVPVIT